MIDWAGKVEHIVHSPSEDTVATLIRSVWVPTNWTGNVEHIVHSPSVDTVATLIRSVWVPPD